jgi:SAM-dependent methyltransferase
MLGIIQDYILEFIKKNGYPKSVLEVGSLDVNGSARGLFKSAYTGIDIQGGKSVDIVMDAMDIKNRFKEEEFDMVMCLETLEHCNDPVRIVENMRWVLQKGGWMLITTPSIGHPIHNWPNDYYRFFESTYKDVFFKDFEDINVITKIWDSPGIEKPNTQYPHAIFGYGRKPKREEDK